MTLEGGGEGGNRKSWKPEILENAKSAEIGMKLDGKNKHKL